MSRTGLDASWSKPASLLLVTDDGQIDRELRAAFATAAPHFTLNIARGRQQIESLDTPAVLLLDLVLANEPPIEFLSWFRSTPRYGRVPVIALAARGLEDHVERAYSLGVNSCFLKTLDRHSLCSIARGIAAYATLANQVAPLDLN